MTSLIRKPKPKQHPGQIVDPLAAMSPAAINQQVKGQDVASTMEHGIRVVDPDGTVVDFLPIEGEGLTTNCCFGGDDLRTLFATDALPGDFVCRVGRPVSAKLSFTVNGTPCSEPFAWPVRSCASASSASRSAVS